MREIFKKFIQKLLLKQNNSQCKYNVLLLNHQTRVLGSIWDLKQYNTLKYNSNLYFSEIK